MLHLFEISDAMPEYFIFPFMLHRLANMTFEGDNNFYVSVNLKRVQSPKPNTVSLHKLVFFRMNFIFFEIWSKDAIKNIIIHIYVRIK